MVKVHICKNCGNEHDGTFASGRFCNIKCSNSFSTKEKRTDINAVVSKKMKGRKYKYKRSKASIQLKNKISDTLRKYHNSQYMEFIKKWKNKELTGTTNTGRPFYKIRKYVLLKGIL